MPDGACVHPLLTEARWRFVWRIKFRDASNKQVKETLGRPPPRVGPRRKAEAAIARHQLP